jgi:hypothetical protein
MATPFSTIALAYPRPRQPNPRNFCCRTASGEGMATLLLIGLAVLLLVVFLVPV